MANKITILPKFAFNTSIKAKVRIVLIKLLTKLDQNCQICKLDFLEFLSKQTPYVQVHFIIFLNKYYSCFSWNNTHLTIDKDSIRKKLGIYPNIALSNKQFIPNLDYVKLYEIINEYNRFRRDFYNKKGIYDFIPDITLTPYNQHALIKLDKFFTNHNITEYYLYFHTLSDKYNFIWDFKACYSAKAFDTWTNNANRVRIVLNQQETAKNNTLAPLSIWVDLYESNEDRKSFLVNKGQEEVCFNNLDENYGYHPKSIVCQNCKLNSQCSEKIQQVFKNISNSDLDIVKIRDKIITVDEANKELAKYGEFRL